MHGLGSGPANGPFSRANISGSNHPNSPTFGEPSWIAEIYRHDKPKGRLFADAVKQALVPSPLTKAGRRLAPNTAVHILVAAIGLHYSDSIMNEVANSAAFARDIDLLSRRITAFNGVPGCFAVLRDISPQHFMGKIRVGSEGRGAYMYRDRTALRCAATDSGLNDEQNAKRNAGLTKVLFETAEKYSVPVLVSAPMLEPRFDAHIEMRDENKGRERKVDCTHFCAMAMGPFEDTLMNVINLRWGDPTPKE